MVDSKICNTCGADKALDQFYKDKNKKDGHIGECKPCRQIRDAKFREEHFERRKQVERASYEKRKVEMVKRAKIARRANPERESARRKRYRENNREVVRERQREKRRANPEAAQISKHRRIARLANLPADLTLEEWRTVKRKYSDSCAYCGKHESENGRRLAMEHIIPVTRGGGTTAKNIIPACDVCNVRKGDKLPEECGMYPMVLKQKTMF